MQKLYVNPSINFLIEKRKYIGTNYFNDPNAFRSRGQNNSYFLQNWFFPDIRSPLFNL